MTIVIYIYNGLTMLDAIGPYEVLRNIKNVDIKFVAKNKGEIQADSQFVHLLAKYDIDDIKQADILIIPGSTIGFVREAKDKKVLDWIQKIDQTTSHTVSVCSGSIILAAAGLLTNKKATSHWKVINLLTKYKAIPVRERFITDGKFITAAGVSAGIDMAIYLTNQLQGEKAAKAAQLIIEYDPKPMFDAGNWSNCQPDIIELAEKTLLKDAKKDLSLWDMISNAGSLKKLL